MFGRYPLGVSNLATITTPHPIYNDQQRGFTAELGYSLVANFGCCLHAAPGPYASSAIAEQPHLTSLWLWHSVCQLHVVSVQVKCGHFDLGPDY